MSSSIFCRRGALGCSRAHFNPRTPCGVRPGYGTAPYSGCQYFNPRTPRGVRRQFPNGTLPTAASFQSTHPLRGATIEVLIIVALVDISIHAPLTGCDVHGLFRLGLALGISIHAPLTGCDTAMWIYASHHKRFQSTHPLRGATAGFRPEISSTRFQSTHPLRGATRTSFTRVLSLASFQSTHPLRGATSGAGEWLYRQGISIHAPLAGCDPLSVQGVNS